MFKKLLTVAMIAGFALPTFAATFTNVKFNNNQTTIDCNAGATVNALFRLDVPAGQTVEKVQVDVIGDNLAPMPVQDVGGELGLQEGIHDDVNLSVTCPQNTGYYNVEVRGAGIFQGQRTISISDPNAVISVNTFTNAIRVVSTGSTPTGSSQIDQVAQLLATVASLQGNLNCMTTGGTWANNVCTPKPVNPAPTGNAAKCALIAPYVNAQANTYSATGMQLQSVILLDNPYAIPALVPGSTVSQGFFGPQTHAALATYNQKYSCN